MEVEPPKMYLQNIKQRDYQLGEPPVGVRSR